MKIIFNFIVFKRSYGKDEEAINYYQEEIDNRREIENKEDEHSLILISEAAAVEKV